MPPLIQWVLLLFGAWLIYLCVSGLLTKKKNLALARLAASWPTVTGRVTSSRIDKGRSISTETRQEIHTFQPHIEVEYSVAGKAYKSTRQAFGKILWYQPAEAEAFLKTYAAGAEVTVYHDPVNPAEAVLDPNPAHATHLAAADFAMLVIGLALAAAGLGAMIF